MFEDLRDNIDFFIRNNTKFSRKNFIEKNTNLIKRNELENLYTKDILNQFLDNTSQEEIQVLDIGCKNWFYAKGEYEFFKSFCSKFTLDGVEIDAYRLYNNFYSRYEVAKYYIKDLKNTNYIAGNLLDLDKKYDYIIWFLPFVVKEPHIYWGLPKKYFYPKKLLKHAYKLLNSDGQMLITNQGKTEAEEQEKLLQELKIPYKALGEIKSAHFECQNKRFGFLIHKN
jgi:hypothetical protein